MMLIVDELSTIDIKNIVKLLANCKEADAVDTNTKEMIHNWLFNNIYINSMDIE